MQRVCVKWLDACECGICSPCVCVCVCVLSFSASRVLCVVVEKRREGSWWCRTISISPSSLLRPSFVSLRLFTRVSDYSCRAFIYSLNFTNALHSFGFFEKTTLYVYYLDTDSVDSVVQWSDMQTICRWAFQ